MHTLAKTLKTALPFLDRFLTTEGLLRLYLDAPGKVGVETASGKKYESAEVDVSGLLKAATHLALSGSTPFDDDHPAATIDSREGERVILLRPPLVRRVVIVYHTPASAASTRIDLSDAALGPLVHQTLTAAAKENQSLLLCGPLLNDLLDVGDAWLRMMPVTRHVYAFRHAARPLQGMPFATTINLDGKTPLTPDGVTAVLECRPEHLLLPEADGDTLWRIVAAQQNGHGPCTLLVAKPSLREACDTILAAMRAGAPHLDHETVVAAFTNVFAFAAAAGRYPDGTVTLVEWAELRADGGAIDFADYLVAAPGPQAHGLMAAAQPSRAWTSRSPHSYPRAKPSALAADADARAFQSPYGDTPPDLVAPDLDHDVIVTAPRAMPPPQPLPGEPPPQPAPKGGETGITRLPQQRGFSRAGSGSLPPPLPKAPLPSASSPPDAPLPLSPSPLDAERADEPQGVLARSASPREGEQGEGGEAPRERPLSSGKGVFAGLLAEAVASDPSIDELEDLRDHEPDDDFQPVTAAGERQELDLDDADEVIDANAPRPAPVTAPKVAAPPPKAKGKKGKDRRAAKGEKAGPDEFIDDDELIDDR